MENLSNEFVQHRHRGLNSKKIGFYAIGLIVLFLFFYFFFLSAPVNFPTGTIVNIANGANLRNISLKLQNEHIIKSRTAFEALVIIYGGEKHLIPADYLFEDKESVSEVARRIVRGERHLAPVKVTIPEGFNVSEIVDAFSLKLANFNKEKFLLLSKDKEGYLFPDTYFFFTTDTETEVLLSMSENFEKKIASIRPQIIALEKTTNRTEKEIIIMASIIEGEAKGDEDRGVIAGILWKRISIGMPLQVDSARETYEVKGLPKSPIGNPGLEAIKVTVYPQNSPYLYYLHDQSGVIHYAKTFSEHQANIKKYLK